MTLIFSTFNVPISIEFTVHRAYYEILKFIAILIWECTQKIYSALITVVFTLNVV